MRFGGSSWSVVEKPCRNGSWSRSGAGATTARGETCLRLGERTRRHDRTDRRHPPPCRSPRRRERATPRGRRGDAADLARSVGVGRVRFVRMLIVRWRIGTSAGTRGWCVPRAKSCYHPTTLQFRCNHRPTQLCPPAVERHQRWRPRGLAPPERSWRSLFPTYSVIRWAPSPRAPRLSAMTFRKRCSPCSTILVWSIIPTPSRLWPI